jgi:hypothetical protein
VGIIGTKKVILVVSLIILVLVLMFVYIYTVIIFYTLDVAFIIHPAVKLLTELTEIIEPNCRIT